MAAAAHRVRYVFSANLERLFPQMVAVSIVVHAVTAFSVIVLPMILNLEPAAPPRNVIDIDLSYNLPKGPSLGPMAPDRDQAAIRQSDPRKLSEIMKERAEKIDADTMKDTSRRQVETNKLGWKDRQRMDAIEKLREKRALMESTGGGGSGTTSTTGVLGIYIANVKSRILSVWSLPGGLPEEYLKKPVLVDVYIAPSGSVIKKVVIRPSGFEPLDRSIESAVMKASPLPPPPALLVDDLKTKGMTLRFFASEKHR
jgi:TonB family protein